MFPNVSLQAENEKTRRLLEEHYWDIASVSSADSSPLADDHSLQSAQLSHKNAQYWEGTNIELTSATPQQQLKDEQYWKGTTSSRYIPSGHRSWHKADATKSHTGPENTWELIMEYCEAHPFALYWTEHKLIFLVIYLILPVNVHKFFFAPIIFWVNSGNIWKWYQLAFGISKKISLS